MFDLIVQTSRFGAMEYQEEQIIHFVKGILGFEDQQQYILLPIEEEVDTFYFLQAVGDGKLGFFLVNPFAFFDYDFELPHHVVQELEIEKTENLKVLTLLSTPGSLQEATTNLMAPIIMNVHSKKAKQVVLENGKYDIKQPLFQFQQEEAVK